MKQAKDVQRPGKREQDVKQGRGIERLCIPFRKKGLAAIIKGVPERPFHSPEAFLEVMGNRNGIISKIAEDKGLQARKNPWPRQESQYTQQQGETAGRNPRAAGFILDVHNRSKKANGRPKINNETVKMFGKYHVRGRIVLDRSKQNRQTNHATIEKNAPISNAWSL